MAYDTILSDYVDAESAAQSGGFEQYRYECACCWEEVRLCAVDSQNQVAHFRHRSGNNNVECENYLGNRNAIINNALSRQNIRDKVEFYFSSTTKLFYFGVRLNSDEITAYEQNGASFQVRNSFFSNPSIYIPIRSSRFFPNALELIPINKFSWEYYVSSSIDSMGRKYELFRKDGRGYLYPSFMKIQAGDNDIDFQAKLVRSDTLYTNTPYLMIFTHQNYVLSFQNDVKVGRVLKFRTMDRDFAGIVVTFINKTSKIELQLEAWKYKLEANESLSLLWPPSSQAEEVMLISKDSAFIYSSFALQAHGNINTQFEDITRLGDGVSKVSINKRTKIYKRNAELVLEKYEESANEYDTFLITEEAAKNYVAADDGAFLFNNSGVSTISKGMSRFLTIESEVRHYTLGYLDRIVRAPNKDKMLVGDHLLQDILIYYKRTESFIWSDYESLELSPVAFAYIESCEKTGRINSVAKYFIEEGRI